MDFYVSVMLIQSCPSEQVPDFIKYIVPRRDLWADDEFSTIYKKQILKGW